MWDWIFNRIEHQDSSTNFDVTSGSFGSGGSSSAAQSQFNGIFAIP